MSEFTNKQPQPVFVLGSGRSGTTLTASLINRLPRIHIAKETGFVSHARTALTQTGDPAALNALISLTNSWLMAEQWTNFATAAGLREFSSRYGLSGAPAFLNYIWQLDCNVAWHDLTYIGDNTPSYVFDAPMIDQLLPNAKYIHVVRDPRDVVCSVLRMRFGANDAVIAALDWHCWIGAWMMAERTIPAERRMELRYEDLCLDPLTQLTRVSKFLGGTPEEAAQAIRRHLEKSADETREFDSVARLQHHTRLKEPISGRSIGRYRTELTPKQIRSIEEVAQNGMLAFGYTPGQWHASPIVMERRVHILMSGLNDLFRRVFRRLRRQSPGSDRRKQPRASAVRAGTPNAQRQD